MYIAGFLEELNEFLTGYKCDTNAKFFLNFPHWVSPSHTNHVE